MKKETHEQKVVRAHRCANCVIAQNQTCAGCDLIAYCQIGRKMNHQRQRRRERREHKRQLGE